MPVTLKDIAARTGLSIPTVHQIISGYAVSFAAETRKRVLDAAKEMDYRPNLSARSLQQRKSFLLGVLFYSANNGYASDFARGLQTAARRRGYAPIFFAHGDSSEELQNLEIVLDRHVDALIVNVALDPADGNSNAARLRRVRETSLPVVEVFGRFLEGAPSVRLDYAAAGRRATQHLIRAGHRRIALYIRENYDGGAVQGLNWAAKDFYEGYCDAVDDAGLERAIVTFDSAGNGAHGSARNVFTHPSGPTAVVCSNDPVASALLQYADRNLNIVPENFEMAIFGGIDSIIPREWPVTVFPALVAQVGATAAESAFELIHKHKVDDFALEPGDPVVVQRKLND